VRPFDETTDARDRPRQRPVADGAASESAVAPPPASTIRPANSPASRSTSS